MTAARLDVDIQLRAPTARYRFRTDAPITGVLGSSGAGKTTLLHALAGLITPASGHIRLGDTTWFDVAGDTNRPAHRRAVGVAFQDDRLFPHLSVENNVRYGATDRAPVDVLLERLGLSDLRRRRIRNLSGGERQRVTLARALARTPDLLLLDEPVRSLDPAARRSALALVRDAVADSRTRALYVSHDLGEILALTDQVLVVERGRAEHVGSMETLAGVPAAWSGLREHGPVNTIAGTITSSDADGGLTHMTIAGVSETVAVPQRSEAAGTPVRYGLRGEDIALALDRVSGTSIQNQLPATVTAVHRHPDRSVVTVRVGDCPLHVEISHRTVHTLALHPGAPVHVLVKSAALRRLD